jgi:hypothetical protein
VRLPEIKREELIKNDIRSTHRPIRKDELDDHERAYQEAKRNKDKQKRIQREKWYAEIGYGVQSTYRYKNKYLERVLDDERMQKQKQRQKDDEKKRYHEKMENYAKFVKEMHWPELSDRKRREMESMKKLLEQRNKPLRSPINHITQNGDLPNSTLMGSGSDDGFSNHGGMTYAESAPNLTKHSRLQPKQKHKKANWKKFKNTMIPSKEPERSPIKVDWLGEQR